MEISEILKSLSNDCLTRLSQEDSPEKLQRAAREMDHDWNLEDAAVVFAALYPWRNGAASIDEETLSQIVGGTPRITIRPSRPDQPL